MSESGPGKSRPSRALICSLIGFAPVVAILWGVISGAAFPLLDSTATAGRGIWVCPVGLLAGVLSLMGILTGVAALGQFGFTGVSAARGQAWIAIALGCVLLAALVALLIYFGNRGLMQ